MLSPARRGAAAVLGSAGAAAPSRTSPDPSATTCRNVDVTVRVAGQAGPVAGTLCTPPGATSVQLVVPGWTYDRYYWEFRCG